jgi:hypothetical protein
VCFACIQPAWSHAQIAINIIAGLGQAGPLTLLIAYIQFTAPHAFLSTATGIAFSMRALGGAFGTAALNAIVNSFLPEWVKTVGEAAVAAGLPPTSVSDLTMAIMTGNIGSPQVFGATSAVWMAAAQASIEVYADAYRKAWASIIPFVILAIVAAVFLQTTRELMTDEIEATVERITNRNKTVGGYSSPPHDSLEA